MKTRNIINAGLVFFVVNFMGICIFALRLYRNKSVYLSYNIPYSNLFPVLISIVVFSIILIWVCRKIPIGVGYAFIEGIVLSISYVLLVIILGNFKFVVIKNGNLITGEADSGLGMWTLLHILPFPIILPCFLIGCLCLALINIKLIKNQKKP